MMLETVASYDRVGAPTAPIVNERIDAATEASIEEENVGLGHDANRALGEAREEVHHG